MKWPDFLVGGSWLCLRRESEHFGQFGCKGFRAIATDLFVEGFAFGVDKLDVGNAGNTKGFGGLLIAVVAVVDIDVGPLEFVMEGLDFLAGVNLVLHGLARRAPGGGEHEDNRLAAFLGVSHDFAIAVLELGAAFWEVLGKSGEGDE